MWFRSHTDLLRAVLPMILEGLTRPHLAPSAALAFRDVCGECAEQLTPFVLQLVLACQVRVVLKTTVGHTYTYVTHFPTNNCHVCLNI